MDFSVTRELTSKIPDKVSTQQIKAGLERIKRAQEQVLQQLKKNHPDSSIDVRNQNSQEHKIKDLENENLKRELMIERQQSVEKSTLYRRRVVDLESSLALHERNEGQLRAQLRALQGELASAHQKYRDLEDNYQKLIIESEKASKNVRTLQKQILELNNRINSENSPSLKNELQVAKTQRNALMAQKVALLKNNSRLESQNIELKMKMKMNSPSESAQYNGQQITKLINQINRLNSAHQFVFGVLKENKKLSGKEIDKQNTYQNSLNKILQMINSMQKHSSQVGGIELAFDNQKSSKDEVQTVEAELGKKHKKQIIKINSEKQQLFAANKAKDRAIEQMQAQNKQLEQKIEKLRQQKNQYMQEMEQQAAEISALKQNRQKTDREGSEKEMKKQKGKDQEYRAIVNELNEQMNTIQKQKKDLDVLVAKMASNKSDQDVRNRKKLDQIVQINQKIRLQNEGIKQKYETILVEKQHLCLSLSQSQAYSNNLSKELARQVLAKQKLISELNRERKQRELIAVQLEKHKLLAQNVKIEVENNTYVYLQEIQRVTQQAQQLRVEISALNLERIELRNLKAEYGLLIKDNQILGRKIRYTNSQVDHLWMIKEVQYQNVVKTLEEMRPL